MDDAAVVRRFEGVGQLAGDAHGLVEWHRALGDPVVQGDALDQLPDQRAPAASSRPMTCAMFE